MAAFPPPPFAHADVSRDELFTGGSLVRLTAEDIKKAVASRQ